MNMETSASISNDNNAYNLEAININLCVVQPVVSMSS